MSAPLEQIFAIPVANGAPFEGVLVNVITSDSVDCVLGYYSDDDGGWLTVEGNLIFNVTHWAPLKGCPMPHINPPGS